MKNTGIVPLNYSAHAIEDIKEFEQRVRSIMPESAQVYRRIIDLLRKSVKFILPNCCDLIDPDDLKQGHLDLTRLPFPVVAFETPWEKEDDGLPVGEFDQTPATRRIALCWDSRQNFELLPGLNSIVDAFPDGGTFILPLFWSPVMKKWVVALGGMFVPFDNTVVRLGADDSLPSASEIARAATLDAGRAKSGANHFRAEPFAAFPELYEQTLAAYKGDHDKAFAQIILDARDEVQTVIQACSVINCANVTTSEVSPPAALNKSRESKGKQPFFTYKVLEIEEKVKRSPNNDLGGTHASPRMHLRRGHLRRLENKVIWVHPSMVNFGSERGAVLKDYAVKGPDLPPSS